MQNENEKDLTTFPFQAKSQVFNHQLKLKLKPMQDYSLLFFSTFAPKDDLWVKVAKNVV